MKILVTGGAGYLGSVLLPQLLAHGHQVRVLDLGYFGVRHVRAIRPRVELVQQDIRRIGDDPVFLNTLLDGCDAIIHLAAISNDPSAELNPQQTSEINYRATTILADGAKSRGIRFLFSSSCSVYGEVQGKAVESNPVNPLTVYAESKVNAERALLQMADAQWSPLILRNGTLFGYSPRMRFDLVINIFSLNSAMRNEIKIYGDGLQWRPFVHVYDCARSFVYFLEQPTLAHRIYNIADVNLRIVDLARIFAALNPRLFVTHDAASDPDQRNYRVSISRMLGEGFCPQITVEQGATEMTDAILAGAIVEPDSNYYRNAKWLKELTRADTPHRSRTGLDRTWFPVQSIS